MVTILGKRRAAGIVAVVVAAVVVAPWAISGARAVTVTEFFGGTTTTTTTTVSSVPDPAATAGPEEAPASTVPGPDVTTPPSSVPPVPGDTLAPGDVPSPAEPPAVATPDLAPLVDPPPPTEGSGDGAELSGMGSNGFPADLQALTDSVERTPSRSTRPLLDALAPLAQYGISPEQAVLGGFGRFPVAGLAGYSHDWWFPRFGPGWRLHQGTDIFAAFNTPIRAPAAGRVHITTGGLGGLAVYVIEPNRTYWYLAHLGGLAPGLVEGSEVTIGQVVGFVGDSGNARGGAPHLHLEFHPGGGPAVDPKFVLDQFLDEAMAGVPQLIATAAQQAAAGAAAQAQAQADLAARSAPDPLTLDGPGRSALLWASSMNPASGAIEVAQAEALRAVTHIDWQRFQREEQEAEWDRMLAKGMVQAWLNRLTPPALASLLGSH